jgi:phospholipase/lecithinase/hemolysin
LEARSEGRERIDVIDPPTNPDKYFPSDPESEQWTKLWDNVIAINRLAREHNAPVMVILFPLEYQVVDENYPTLPQELLTARATQSGIPELDLLPAFRKACEEKPGGGCSQRDHYLFADVWMHPSAYGHKLAAAELEPALVGMLP